MRIIKDHPKQSTWKVTRTRNPNGSFYYVTGTRYGIRGGEMIPNFIFEAKLVESGGSFKDLDNGEFYQVTNGSMMKMLRGFISGHLQAENNVITGYFTFCKEGNTISIIPYIYKNHPEKAPSEIVEVGDDVLDITNILASLK